jgi:hypothetical protein
VPFSLPFIEAAELGTPRAEVKLYRELTLIRLLPVSGFVSAVDMDDRLDGMNAGSGSCRIDNDSGLYAPASRRGVVSSDPSTTALALLAENGTMARSWVGFQISEPVDPVLL